ncbi:hypothetical protein [Streptomyces acidiscabies]|uniref:Uncharacterized protein n=1 Tax=Streptomyces acidiscabies TaxID=42234 RepID=A0AAP6EHQ9_9ACTN|nr:hypothetical protein [Streptomyces acidiscabies]MBP5942101.1 hypothetical protein [Streptomyces sp. LBUM 1476]MBZ3913601.1 hypothetical protein [Streptomyces acidiscabies]MDX2963437.1 hypothetical protein [Streptomyces acidiscabies]MDX3023171.1 hypothetical protein [Streptomyces acidiscabies]MDX3792683.1 hypothetical protein [Streptomyces acidiscabies]
MVPASRAAHNIEITAESLQEDLSRLELQKRALERELAAVVAHLGSVQRALSALEYVMATPAEATPVRTATAPVTPSDDVTPVSRRPAARKGAGKKREPLSQADTERTYGRLTEEILEYLAQVGDTDVRARDVATALGRATDSGSINAIRSTLDRLVGASRIRRTGRGLYRAQRP